MTLRDAVGADASHIYERVDEVLDSEEGILLVDRRRATSHLQGFATGRRMLGQGLQSLAGAIGVVLLFPVAILIVGLPIALAVRLVVEAVAWLTALAHS